ncbi:MAG: hypothetical protein SF123_02490 [Chloroflexota bacterium]|nr:hypothetical protein [Chloroflexota bacterium]
MIQGPTQPSNEGSGAGDSENVISALNAVYIAAQEINTFASLIQSIAQQLDIEERNTLTAIVEARIQSLNQIAAARDGALERIGAAGNLDRRAQHNQAPLPGKFTPTIE